MKDIVADVDKRCNKITSRHTNSVGKDSDT